MRSVLLGGGALLVAVAACTLIVPIDDDLTSGSADSGALGASRDGAVGAPLDGGARDASIEAEAFDPPRDGCPNGVATDPHLVGYYPLDESEGALAHDCTKYAHDLPVTSATTPAWSPSEGHTHGAADFNGTDTCFGTADTSVFAFEGKPFSISVWVFARLLFQASDKTGRWIFGHKTSPNGWHVGVDDPNRAELDLEWVAATVNRKDEISSIVAASTWFHFAATYSPTGEAAAYLNGKLTEGQTGPDNVPAMFDTGPNTTFRIGCRQPKSGVFDGKLDEVRIYDRVLSQDEIAALAAR